MRKILSLIPILILVTLGLQAQTLQINNIGGTNTMNKVKNQITVDSAYRGPLDTLKSAPQWSEAYKNGVKYFKGSDNFWHPTIASINGVNQGTTGTPTVTVSGSNVQIPLIRDSAGQGVHHAQTPDGGIVLYGDSTDLYVLHPIVFKNDSTITIDTVGGLFNAGYILGAQISGTPTNNQTLVFNSGTGKWGFGSAAGGSVSITSPNSTLTGASGSGASFTLDVNPATNINFSVSQTLGAGATFGGSLLLNANGTLTSGNSTNNWLSVNTHQIISNGGQIFAVAATNSYQFNVAAANVALIGSVGQGIFGSITDNNAFLQVGAANTTTRASLYIAPSSAVNVTSPVDGMLWYNGTNLNFRHGSTTVDLLAAGGGSGAPFSDASALVKNGTDATKLVILSAASVATGTTRTWTFPNQNGTFADQGTSLAQFAATTSAQVAGIVSDETGSGKLTFATSPTESNITLSANTTSLPNLKFTASGIDITSPTSGMMWYNGTNLYFSTGLITKDLLTANLLTSQVVTSGSSVTGTTGNLRFTLNPSSTLATFTFTMPSSPNDQQVVEIEGGGTLTTGTIATTFTVSPNSGQTIIQPSAPTTLVAGAFISYKYNTFTGAWMRRN